LILFSVELGLKLLQRFSAASKIPLAELVAEKKRNKSST
jgi:hypothetical protein